MAASTAFSAAATAGGDSIYRLAQAFAFESNNLKTKPNGYQAFYWTGTVPTASLDEINDEYYFLKFPGNFTLLNFRLLIPAQGAAASFNVVAQNDAGTEELIQAAVLPSTGPAIATPVFGVAAVTAAFANFWGSRYNIANKFLGIKCVAPGAAPAGAGFQLIVWCHVGEIRSIG